MVLTVTLNPLLERRLNYSSVKYGEGNRNGISELRAGGKGINVSRQLNKLSVDNNMLTFAGGQNGRILKDILYKESLKPVLIRTESETREALIIVEKDSARITTCFEKNQDITDKEANEFRDKLFKMIPNYEMIVFSGSIPSENLSSIIPDAISLCNELDKVSICDTYGTHLQDCINAKPTVLHNNISELKNSLGIELENEEHITGFLKELYSKEIKQAYITNGNSSFYASNFDFIYKVGLPEIKEIDSTGSGDAFCAGLVYGWDNDLVFEETLKTAAALGAANASLYETCSVELNEALKYMNDITVKNIGKKMKQVDVTPQ